MTCCGYSKRSKKKVRRYKKRIYPDPQLKNQKVDASFMENFLRETMHCGTCRKLFQLNSNDLKIHCNICNQFYHCGIAGECIGDNCKIIKSNNKIHRASYCNNCVAIKYEDGKCLCKDCSK